MALDHEQVAKLQQRLPKLWSLVEAFTEKYKGALHSNWGAPLSVRTKLKEGRLEVDFSEKELLLRFERLRLPAGVSFTTNAKYFAGHYPKPIGRPGAGFGWEVQGGDEADEVAIRQFLDAPATAEDLRLLSLGRREWISIDPEGIFLMIRSNAFERLESVIKILCRVARRYSAEVPVRAARSSRLRVTGQPPSLAQLQKWSNWKDCLGEEDEDGQDETTIRPDIEQSVIGEETSCTAFHMADATGRQFLGFGRAADAEDLHKGRLNVLFGLARRGRWEVNMHDARWEPSPFTEWTALAVDDPRLPITVSSVLPLQTGRHVEFILKANGRLTRPKAKDLAASR